MFILKKKFTFEAAHYLPHHDGKCQRMHGHSWVGWLEVAGADVEPNGPKAGMVVDFGDLGSAIRPLLENYLDHFCLNETLGVDSPTSEVIARWIFDQLASSGTRIDSVTIEETCTSVCTYRPDH